MKLLYCGIYAYFLCIMVHLSHTLHLASHTNVSSSQKIIARERIIYRISFSGLLHYPEGALNVDADPETLSEMFRSFHSLLVKIRDLLHVLDEHELSRVEKALCTGETQLKFGKCGDD